MPHDPIASVSATPLFHYGSTSYKGFALEQNRKLPRVKTRNRKWLKHFKIFALSALDEGGLKQILACVDNVVPLKVCCIEANNLVPFIQKLHPLIHNKQQQKMKLAILSSILATAAAFAPAGKSAATTSALSAFENELGVQEPVSCRALV